MVAIIAICLVLIYIGVAFCISLRRSDIQEWTGSFSLPFKIELKFKKKEDKETQKENT